MSFDSVYALYEKKKVIGFLLALYVTAELGAALWVYSAPGGHRESLDNYSQRILIV